MNSILAPIGMPEVSKKAVAKMNFLINDDSNVNSCDDQVVDSKTVAVVQYAALMICLLLFRGSHYYCPDVRGEGWVLD
jgi:hypothetical protein